MATANAAGELRRTEIDGVPVFWADVPGPFTGAIRFRVGYADETLPTSGVTHLVEHLALRQFGGGPNRGYNGHVGPLFTTFHSDGAPEEVARFLESTCRAFAALPLDALEV